MAQHKIVLTERQRHDFFIFMKNVVQPKSRDEARLLKGVILAFQLEEIMNALENMPSLPRTSFSDQAKVTVSVETMQVQKALEYLDLPGATAMGSLAILDISDILFDAKERPVSV